MSLTFPSLKCVLEHLEANKRLYITVRCPQIQKFEKSIPLHLDYLSIYDSSVAINDIDYDFQQLWEDDYSLYIVMKRSNTFRFRFKLENLKKTDFKTEIFVQKLTEKFLRGGLVYVQEFRNRYDHLSLSKDLQLIPRKIEVSRWNLEKIQKQMHPDSYPLKSFETDKWLPEFSNLQMIRTSEHLEITSRILNFNQAIKGLLEHSNRSVNIQHVEPEGIIEIVENWLEIGKEIGTCWTIRINPWRREVKTIMNTIKERFDWNYVKLRESVKGFWSKYGCLSLQINPESELNIYMTNIKDYSDNWIKRLNLRVMPIGSTYPDSISYQISSLKNSVLNFFNRVK